MKLKRSEWLKKTSKIMQSKPFLWSKESSDNHANALAESFYDEEYDTPERAVEVVGLKTRRPKL